MPCPGITPDQILHHLHSYGPRTTDELEQELNHSDCPCVTVFLSVLYPTRLDRQGTKWQCKRNVFEEWIDKLLNITETENKEERKVIKEKIVGLDQHLRKILSLMMDLQEQKQSTSTTNLETNILQFLANQGPLKSTHLSRGLGIPKLQLNQILNTLRDQEKIKKMPKSKKWRLKFGNAKATR